MDERVVAVAVVTQCSTGLDVVSCEKCEWLQVIQKPSCADVMTQGPTTKVFSISWDSLRMHEEMLYLV